MSLKTKFEKLKKFCSGHLMAGKREVVIDEEMTDLDLAEGGRTVEIGCIELIDGVPTGRTYHSFINPQGRPMSAIAAELTGLTDEFLAQQPQVTTVAREVRDFIGDSPIIVFCWSTDGKSPDQNFLNNEMQRASLPAFPDEQWVNIRDWAAEMFVLGRGSLNKMLDRYGIDHAGHNDNDGHGALGDALLTARLYPKLKAEWKSFKQTRHAPAPPIR